ncbi:hypothetical protein PENTCL1PPCAC_2513 [Pristionchus entomophagus]|uniref:Choline/carnitine acyltransferase domain-containing protein n=1 Tax=Pristionchus entomophagus TaxID=358040 RepID=A0AAV5SI43_9BILA|nr:hypothetical protein PENTCL1PPCAC_2513 [Pristionchus entomophagus]
MSEKTFSLQDSLPSLTVPSVDETMDRYLETATVLLTPEETAKTRKAVEEFRKSKHVEFMQNALEDRAKRERNWLEDWWYDAYLEMRLPLVPFTSVASINPAGVRSSKREVQTLTAAEATHHMMKVWQKTRREEIPIMKSRGIVWDMKQNHVLFNSNRTPGKPKDRMDRYFKTESEGPCPSHVIVLCRGSIWKVEMEVKGEIRSSDDTVRILRHIQHESPQVTYSPITLTTTDRDRWAEARDELAGVCRENERNLRTIEESSFVVTLSDDVCPSEEESLRYAMMGRSETAWVDKCMNIIVMADSQMINQGDHSNLDAIVMLDALNKMGAVMRKGEWKVKESAWQSDLPERFNFQLTASLVTKINEADSQFEKMKHTFRAKVVRFTGYGNDRLKRVKIYTDTVVQIALQLAFYKVHGSFGPIYETASIRKFYHGRTETVRGLTRAMKEFGEGVREGKEEKEQLRLFKKAYDAHNHLMAEATNARGVDRHLYGLRKSLQSLNSGGKCQPKLPLPSLFTDEAWKKSGGDGNFLLSTSFIGYADGVYGYVCAMREDGYGTFYLTQPNQILLTITDYVGTKSDLDAYGREIEWSLNHLGKLIDAMEKYSKL